MKREMGGIGNESEYESGQEQVILDQAKKVIAPQDDFSELKISESIQEEDDELQDQNIDQLYGKKFNNSNALTDLQLLPTTKQPIDSNIDKNSMVSANKDELSVGLAKVNGEL